MRRFSGKFFALFFIGMANAVALPLFGSTLSIYLTEMGFSKQVIGWMTLTHLPLLGKIFWSYPVDHVTLPTCRRTPRKGWLLLALLGMVFSFLSFSLLTPSLLPLACTLLLLAFSASILYVVGLHYELELLEVHEYATGSFYVTLGYRLGLLAAGAGILGVAHVWGWPSAFQLISLLLVLAWITIFLLPEPPRSPEQLAGISHTFSENSHTLHGEFGSRREEFVLPEHSPPLSESQLPSAERRFLQRKCEKCRLAEKRQGRFWRETLLIPLLRLVRLPTFPLLLLVLLVSKTGDQLTHAMQGPFFLSLGFDKGEISLFVKSWGMLMTLSGGFLGALLLRYAYSVRLVVYTHGLHTLTLGGYLYLSLAQKSSLALLLCIMAEHVTVGMAMSALIVFLWRTVEKAYAPVQYAFCWTLLVGKGILLTWLGGLLASCLSWFSFYLFALALGLAPLLFFLLMVRRGMAPAAQE